MLLMRYWLETRWRLTAMLVYLILTLAINYRRPGVNRPVDPLPITGMKATSILIAPFMILTFGALTLAGCGVKTQSAIGFPEGLAESTQFTLALPVSRRRLMAVRTTFGLTELSGVTLIAGCLAWSFFPALRASTTPADFVRAVLTTLLWLTGPYCAAVLFETVLAEPLSMVLAGWTFILLLWLLHLIAPAVDIIRAFGQASPLITHRLPWPQLATSVGLASILFLVAVWIVQTREY
jgi:hypothetical protein